MRILNLVIINLKKHVYKAYKNGNEAAYAAYRAVTGANIADSWKIVKPWIKKWEGKNEY